MHKAVLAIALIGCGAPTRPTTTPVPVAYDPIPTEQLTAIVGAYLRGRSVLTTERPELRVCGPAAAIGNAQSKQWAVPLEALVNDGALTNVDTICGSGGSAPRHGEVARDIGIFSVVVADSSATVISGMELPHCRALSERATLHRGDPWRLARLELTLGGMAGDCVYISAPDLLDSNVSGRPH